MIPKLLLAAASALLLCGCSTRENVLLGSAEGLAPGDCIYLLVLSDTCSSVYSDDWIIADSVTVTRSGRFEFRNTLADQPVRLLRIAAGESPEQGRRSDSYFLEGYGTLHLNGTAEQWEYLRPRGGIYAHPDLQFYVTLRDSAHSLQRQGIPLFNKGIMETHPDAAFSAYTLAQLQDAPDWYREKYESFSPSVQATPAGRPRPIWLNSTVSLGRKKLRSNLSASLPIPRKIGNKPSKRTDSRGCSSTTTIWTNPPPWPMAWMPIPPLF